MSQQSSFIRSLLGGALGGVIAVLILTRQPQFLQRIANLSQPNTSSVPITSFEPNDSHEAAVTRVVQQTQPAVVSIVISKDVPVLERYFQNVPNNNFFDPFGGLFDAPQIQIPSLRQNGTQKQEIGGGSGFLVSADGYVITNKHVVSQDNAEYTVFTNDGKKYNAKIVAKDPSNDIAILKVDGSNFPHLEFGNSDSIQVGQSVVAIGNALGEFRNTVSVGVISGLSRSITAGDGSGQTEQLDEVLQTDAAINPGNSGGPLLNLQGKVIGVNVAVALGSQSVGFAMPSNTVSSVFDQVKSGGKISRPFLGVRYVPVTAAVKETNKLPVDYGVLVVRGETPQELAVTPGSSADKVGIVEGDVILEIDGTKLDENTSLASVIRKKKVGDTVSLKVLHKGEQKTINVTLSELPSS